MRESPQVVDHRVDPAVLAVDDLEVWTHARELAEAWEDSGIRARAGNVDRVELVSRDPARVP